MKSSQRYLQNQLRWNINNSNNYSDYLISYEKELLLLLL